MPRLIALTVSVGVLAVLATWIFGLDPLVVAKLQVWQAFIAWGLIRDLATLVSAPGRGRPCSDGRGSARLG